MIREQQLSDVLNEFARTMLTDFPIQAILDRLVVRIVDVLPVTSAGVTLIAPDAAPCYVAASDASALRFEQLQTELGEGPCVAACETGEAVAVADLHDELRFPGFAPRALAAGLGAVFTFPMRRDHLRLGALDLYRDTPGPLDADSVAAAQTLADVASAYVQNAQARVELAAAYDQARERALHDPLTGLPNRVLLAQRLDQAGARARRSGTTAGVLFVDLDRFKWVNDTHGHRAGDELLVAVAERLGSLLRPSDTLARLAGDEFVVLCEDLDEPSRVEALAARVNDALSSPFVLSGATVAVTASVGVAFAGRADDIPARLVHDADEAMYEAKRMGGARHQVVDLLGHRLAERRSSLANDLHGASARGELRVEYQPIVDLATTRVREVEALLRWEHPRFGAVSPAVVAPLAEAAGLVPEIGRWVLERACADRHGWHGHDLRVWVDVSAHQLMSRDYAATVESVLRETSTAPHLVTLEVTEGVFAQDPERALVVLRDLREVGVAVALAQFGSGAASFGHFRHFMVDAVKLDRVLVADLPRDQVGSAIVSAIVRLAHDLDARVVAEGVDTVAQRAAVAALGCDEGQGSHFARPMPAHDLTVLLDAGAAGDPLSPPPLSPPATAGVGAGAPPSS